MKNSLELKDKTILVTGSAGFIGANLVLKLLDETGAGTVVSLDDLNDYYDPALKEYRLSLIAGKASLCKAEHVFIKGSLDDRPLINSLFEKYRFDIVVNLAARAGVRYSIDHPDEYIKSNITGFYNILEACRAYPVKHLVFASSSSVYGDNTRMPFSTEDKTDKPVSLYAATKKSDELMAYAYSGLYGIPATGLRFFTVYGPAGRPDMFYYSTAEKLRKGEKIRVFNHGDLKRDFTYIDDIVEGMLRVIKGAPVKGTGDRGQTTPPYSVYNIGRGRSEKVSDFLEILKEELVSAGVLPEDFDLGDYIEFVRAQPGDMRATCADTGPLAKDYGFMPRTGIREGLKKFALWYKEYHGI